LLTGPQIERIAALIEARCGGLDALFVYGSEAADRARADSDLDLAVRAPRPVEPADLLEIRAELSRQLGREVDLVDLAAASPILAMQVVRKGRLVVDAHPTRPAELQARIFSQYADLKRVRAEAESALLERVGRA
jgi:predicted nucleotidyltransferase